jgi:hypothetical protein
MAARLAGPASRLVGRYAYAFGSGTAASALAAIGQGCGWEQIWRRLAGMWIFARTP